MLYCSVDGCFSNNKYGNIKRTLFRCPVKNLERALKWQQFCGESIARSHRTLHICDLHFLKSDLYIGENQKSHLKSNAVPCLNGPKKPKDVQREEIETVGIESSFDGRQDEDPGISGQNSSRITTKSSNKNQTKSKLALQNLLNSSLDKLKQVNPKIQISVLKPVSTVPKTAKVVPVSIITDANGSKLFVPLNSKSSTEKALVESCLKPNQSVNNITEQKPVEKTYSKSVQSIKRVNQEKVQHTLSKVFKRANAHFEITLHHETKSKESEEKNISNSDVENPVFTETRTAKISYGNGLDFDVKVKSTIDFEVNDNQLPESNNIPKLKASEQNVASGRTYDLSCLKEKSRRNVDGERKKKNRKRTGSADLLPEPLIGETEYTSSPVGYTVFNKRNPVFIRYTKQRRTPVNLTDPKFSIAATADSIGTFNSFIEKPLEKVDVKNNEWNKLFIPSGFKYPKLAKSHIGSIVNQLREKLPHLNGKDMLDVVFVLNMMSIYPSVPERIKEEMFQRLCMVFIATTFKWDTALALAQRVEETLVTDAIVETNDLESKNTAMGEDIAGSQKEENILKNLPKHPKFPFEIIVHEKAKRTGEPNLKRKEHGYRGSSL